MVFSPIVPISHFAFAFASETTARVMLLVTTSIYGFALFRTLKNSAETDAAQWCCIAGCAIWFGVAYAFTKHEPSGPTPDVYQHPAYIVNWLACTTMVAVSLIILWTQNTRGNIHKTSIVSAALFSIVVFINGIPA